MERSQAAHGSCYGCDVRSGRGLQVDRAVVAVIAVVADCRWARVAGGHRLQVSQVAG